MPKMLDYYPIMAKPVIPSQVLRPKTQQAGPDSPQVRLYR